MLIFFSSVKNALLVCGLVFAVSLHSQLSLANSPSLNDKIVAIVNDDVITSKELNSRVFRLISEKRIPQKPSSKVIKDVLTVMTEELVQIQQAKRLRVEISDTQLQTLATQFAARQGVSLAALKDGLARDGIDYFDLLKEIKTSALVQQMLRRESVRTISIDKQELDEFIKANNVQPKSREYDLTHLFVETPSDNNQKFESKISSLARKNAFNSLQALFTKEGFSVKSRELTSQKAQQLPTLFAKAIQELRVGEKSSVIMTSSGAHILQLNDIKGSSLVIEKRKAQHILINAKSRLEFARAEKTINRLKAQLLQGDSFTDLATYYSDDSGSAALGGDLGWVRKGQMVPEFEKALFSLAEGEVSEPVVSVYGVHIIKLNEVSVSSDPDEEVREIAFNALMSRKVDQFYPVWLSELVGKSYIKYL